MKRIHNRVAKCILTQLLLCVACTCLAQNTNSGDIRGVVTDTSGAVIQGATVSVLNVQTGVSKTIVTNQDGVYDTSSIVTGQYKLTFQKSGFANLVRGPITLIVGYTTVNAELKPGSNQEQIVVTADVPLLQTESGEQSQTLDSETLQQLPQVGEDWQNFLITLPGFQGVNSANPGQYVSANGNMPFNNTLADGASVTTDHSQNFISNTFATLSEVQVSTSSFSAQYGVGGIIFNQISKGGTSQFHGSAYEYLMNNDLNAASFGFYSQPSVPVLHRNQFGGTIGGPILKRKMFFFFNYDQTVNRGAATSGTYSVPTTDVMNGNFTGQQTIYDPTTQTIAYDSYGNPYPVRQSFISEYGSNAIPQSLFDKVAMQIQKFYPTPTNHIPGGKFVPGSIGAEGEIQNNFYSSLPQSQPNRSFFGRLDYDVTPKNRLTMTDMDNDSPAIYPNPVIACPVGCEAGDVEDTDPQITDVWTINQSTINEARMGFMYAGNFFGDLTLDKNYPSLLGWQFAKANSFPGSGLYGTYPYSWIEPSINAVYKSMTFDPSDVITMIRGKHILHFGAELLFYREDSTAWGNTTSGFFGYDGRYTQQWTVNPATGVASPDTQTGLEYANFLLGYAAYWTASVAPEYGGRMKSPQAFIQDDYKVRRNLTLNLGMRYQMNHGWNEVHGNMSSYDPTVMNPASGTPGAYWYATTHANGRTSLQADQKNIWMPRLGFSWLFMPKTTLRGGFGIYSQFLDLDNYGGNNTSYGMGAAISSSGSIFDQTFGITPITKLDGSGTIFGTSTPLPYTSASTDPARFNFQNVGYIQYHTPVPKSYQWDLEVQRELGTDYVFKLAYVANHGTNEIYNTDLNQVPANKLSSNDWWERPNPYFQGIFGSTNDAISNYNSLQASITKRMTKNFSLNFSYVWSHFLDDQDSAGRGGYGGPVPVQQAGPPSLSYSNANFDVRNSFKGYAVYQLPFGRGRLFLNQNRLVDEVVGGWRVSGTINLSSGEPFSVYGTQQTYALSGVAFPNWIPGVSTKPQHRSARCESSSSPLVGCVNEWYNPAAFSRPADGTFGNVRRNSLYGPGINTVNLAGGKNFDLGWEGMKLEVRAEAVNAFNHASFGQPTGTLSGAANVGDPYSWSVGQNSQQINSVTQGGRSVQLSAHLSF